MIRASLIAFVLVALVIPMAAHAACNPPGNQWAQLKQYLLDWKFEETTCTAWTFVGGATRAFNADQCSNALLSNFQANLQGLSGAAVTRGVYQDIFVDGNSPFSVSFYLDIKGNMTAWDRLTVTIRNPSTNAVLETVTIIGGNQSSLDCSYIGKTLSGNYTNQNVRVYFEAQILTGVSSDAFIVDGVSFHSNL